MVARVSGVVSMVPRGLLGCCYAVAEVPWVVAKVLLCGC